MAFGGTFLLGVAGGAAVVRAHTGFGLWAMRATFMLLLLVPQAALAQEPWSKADYDCWNRHRDRIDYVKCVAAALPPLDPKRREEFGEFYGAKEFLHCALTQPPGDTGCDRHRLRRRPQPEYWPYAGKVPPVKWPAAPAQSVYRKGMTPREYFDALCKAEAGEFIYRTVENVEGVYQIRPRLRATDYELEDRYVLEDPYGDSGAIPAMLPERLVQPPIGVYRFLESPNHGASKSVSCVRHFRGEPVDGKWAQYMVPREGGNLSGRKVPYVVRDQVVESLNSAHGFTWRGIKRELDRVNGIAGGEFLIVDLKTNEILGIRRGFALGHSAAGKAKPAGDRYAECPENILASGNLKFIEKVLRPRAALGEASDAAK